MLCCESACPRTFAISGCSPRIRFHSSAFFFTPPHPSTAPRCPSSPRRLPRRFGATPPQRLPRRLPRRLGVTPTQRLPRRLPRMAPLPRRPSPPRSFEEPAGGRSRGRRRSCVRARRMRRRSFLPVLALLVTAGNAVREGGGDVAAFRGCLGDDTSLHEFVASEPLAFEVVDPQPVDRVYLLEASQAGVSRSSIACGVVANIVAPAPPSARRTPCTTRRG